MILAATLAVAILLTGLGFFAERMLSLRSAETIWGPIYALVAGWALCAAVAAVCAVFGLKLTGPMAALGVVGLLGLFAALDRRDAGRAALVVLLVLPLLFIAATIPPTMYDEFAQWLPNGLYLVEHDGFASITAPNDLSDKPGYPPGLPLVGYLVNKITGEGFEIGPKIFNVLLAAGFGFVLADIIASRIGAALAIIIGVAAATVLNPFLDPRIAMTSYADTPSAFVLAICLAACSHCVATPSALWLWRVGAAAVALVLLRETNVVFVAALAFGLLIGGRRAVSTLIALVVPSIFVFAVWRLHLYVAGIMPPIKPQAFAQWDWQAPMTVFKTLVTDRLMNNPILGFGAILSIMFVAILSARTLRAASAHRRRLLGLVAVVTIVWTAFLAWSYMAVFSPDEVLQASSAWRYMAQLGPTWILAIIAILVRDRASENRQTTDAATNGSHSRRAGIAVVAGIAVFCAPLAMWRHWKIDCRYPDVTIARLAILAAAHELTDRDTVYVFHHEATLRNGYAILASYEQRHLPQKWLPVTAPESAPHDGLLLDLREVDSIRMSKPAASLTITLSRWSGEGWQPVRALAYGPADYACRLW